MGSFQGHVLPGAVFLIIGIWWAGKFSLWHTTRRNKSFGSTRLASRTLQRRLEIIENCFFLVCSVIGMICEQYVANGPMLHLYDFAGKHWEQLHIWQHTTMYLFFFLAAVVSLILHTTKALPAALDKLMLGIAFFVEGFLFLYHLHGRTMLDVHVHQLLLYAIFGESLIFFLEVFHRDNIILDLLCCTLTLLQGSWFWEIGFVLYPPNGTVWDMKDHNTMMFITMCFSWHLAFAILVVGVVYGTVSCVVRSRLKRTPPMEMGLLKPRERDAESEDEIL